MILILLAIFILSYILFLKVKKTIDILQPSVIFTLLILITYFLTTLRFSLLQNVYPFWFTLLILGFVFVFFLGDKSSKFLSFAQPRSNICYSLITMRILSFMMWVIIMFSFVQMVRILGSPPAISKANRAEYFVSGWGSIVITQSAFFGLILYDRFNRNANRAMYWIYLSSISLIAFLLSNKFQIIYMIVLFLISYNSYYKKLKVKSLLWMGIISILLFVLLFEFVYEDMYGVSLDTLFLSYRMTLPRFLKFLTQPYLYVSFNYDNLYQFMISDTKPLYGLKTFGAILEILGLKELYPISISENLSQWQSLLRIKSLTTGTMFQDFAQDGGVLWMLFMTYLCGLWSGITYKAFKNNKNFSNFFLYSATTVAIFMAFFSNVFTSKVTIINIVAALLISLFLKINLVYRKV